MKNIIVKKGLLLFLTSGILLTACYKKFDPKSYQPSFTINGYTSSTEIGAGHLVGYWAFDGSYVDSISNTEGTGIGTSFSEGFKGQALQGALNSYALSAPSDAVKNLQSFTITEWVKTPPPSTGIIDIFTLSNTTQFWGNIEVFFENGSDNTNGKIRVHIYHNGGDHTYDKVNTQPNLFNSWVNLSISYDAASSVVTVFVNGTKISSGTLDGVSGPLSFADVGNLVFGCPQFQTSPSQTSGSGHQDWASFLTGQIDEVRVYDVPLTENDLQALIILQGKGK